MLGASGGLFIVPLYTLMQTQARENERAQIIAANNIYNSIYMVGSAVLGIVCLSVLELAIPTLFLLLAVLNIFVATYVYWQVPMFLSRLVLWMFTHTMYRVKHKNLINIPKEGGALIVCNHVSYMDALLMIGACKRQICFVMEEEYAHFLRLKHYWRTVALSRLTELIVALFAKHLMK